MSEPVVFSAALDGIVRAYGPQLTPSLRAQVKAQGVDLDVRQVAWPVDVFLAAFLTLADALVPGEALTRPQRLRTFGRAVTDAFGSTTIGAATFTLARVLGVRRSLQRAGRSIRNTGNYLDAEGVVQGPTEVHLVTRVRPEFVAHIKPSWQVMELYRVGVVEGFLGQLGATSPAVEVLSREAGGVETRYRVTWRD